MGHGPRSIDEAFTTHCVLPLTKTVRRNSLTSSWILTKSLGHEPLTGSSSGSFDSLTTCYSKDSTKVDCACKNPLNQEVPPLETRFLSLLYRNSSIQILLSVYLFGVRGGCLGSTRLVPVWVVSNSFNLRPDVSVRPVEYPSPKAKEIKVPVPLPI